MGYLVGIFTGNIICFVAGTALTWSSPMMNELEHEETSPFDRALTPEETSWISATLPVGAIFGPFVFGFLADKTGRKCSLLICGIPLFVSFMIFALSPYLWTFYLARYISGMSVGGTFTVMPMYAGELAEPSNRGMLGTIMNCFICFGFFFSYAVGAYIHIFEFNLILAVFPVVYVLLFAITAPESPQYYIMKKNHKKARAALLYIRNKNEAVIDQEINEMEEREKEKEGVTFIHIFRSKGLTKAFIIIVCLLAFQQFSGINAVLFYTEDIFKEAHSDWEPELCSILVGFTQFLTSFVTPFTVDKYGRKKLLTISCIGIVIVEIPFITYCFLEHSGRDVENITFIPVISLIAYIIVFNIGLAILPWSMMGELFPPHVRSIASSSATAVTWTIGFVIARTFQIVVDEIGMGIAFTFFACCTTISIPFIIFYTVETKGKTLDEIQEILNA